MANTRIPLKRDDMHHIRMNFALKSVNDDKNDYINGTLSLILFILIQTYIKPQMDPLVCNIYKVHVMRIHNLMYLGKKV